MCMNCNRAEQRLLKTIRMQCTGELLNSLTHARVCLASALLTPPQVPTTKPIRIEGNLDFIRLLTAAIELMPTCPTGKLAMPTLCSPMHLKGI